MEVGGQSSPFWSRGANLGGSNESILGKRKREKEEKEKGLDQEDVNSNNPEKDLFNTPEKRKREILSERICVFKDSTSSLAQSKKYENLLKRIQELQDTALYFQKLNTSTAIEEAEKEWAEMGVDSTAWEKEFLRRALIRCMASALR